MLKEKANEITEKQRDLLVEQEKVFCAKEELERLKIDLKERKCPNCANNNQLEVYTRDFAVHEGKGLFNKFYNQSAYTETLNECMT